MATNEKRFGISLLSKKNNDIAYKEEVMIDKLTGDIAIKTPVGDIISYNYNAKFNEHLKSVRNDANNLSVYGKIFNIPFTNKIMPMVLESESNLTNSVYITNSSISGFILHADIDSVAVNIDEFTMDRYFAKIAFQIKLYWSDGTESDIISVSTDTLTLNNTVYDLTSNKNLNISAANAAKTVQGIELIAFNVFGNIKGDKSSASNVEVRHILNSLFIAIKE